MINILNTKPELILNGRLNYSLNYVDKNDLINKRILNIGCGFGWFELNILKYDIDEAIGIEITDKDLDVAKSNITNQKIKFEIGSAIDLPYEDNSFDTIVSWEVLEYIPKNTEIMMFKEINRVLKNQGICYFSTPYKSFFSTVFDPAWWLIGHRHYSKKQLNDLLSSYSYEIQNITTIGKHWEIFSWWNLYIAKWIFRRDPFFDLYVKAKLDKEWSYSDDGYTNIFYKIKALK
ncbi:MAG: ubiquinone/menaquinone biosynthesis C-methylase UbiE [Clostridium sp.]|jgi:ubiquinone/menaquinone biosynthesis C-methylase UbiE